jgi:hypothetical protein
MCDPSSRHVPSQCRWTRRLATRYAAPRYWNVCPNTPNNEGATEYQIRTRLESLLRSIDAFRELSDEELAGPAPKSLTDGRPLAERMLEFRRDTLVRELEVLKHLTSERTASVSWTQHPRLARPFADLFPAIGRMLAILHPAHSQTRWRDGQIPQERHLGDPWPPSPPFRLPWPKRPAVAQFAGEFAELVTRLLDEDTRPDQIGAHPDCQELVNRFITGKGKPPDGEAKWWNPSEADWREYVSWHHARREVEHRLAEWSNAENAARRFLTELNENQSSDTTARSPSFQGLTLRDLIDLLADKGVQISFGLCRSYRPSGPSRRHMQNQSVLGGSRPITGAQLELESRDRPASRSESVGAHESRSHVADHSDLDQG